MRNLMKMKACVIISLFVIGVLAISGRPNPRIIHNESNGVLSCEYELTNDTRRPIMNNYTVLIQWVRGGNIFWSKRMDSSQFLEQAVVKATFKLQKNKDMYMYVCVVIETVHGLNSKVIATYVRSAKWQKDRITPIPYTTTTITTTTTMTPSTDKAAIISASTEPTLTPSFISSTSSKTSKLSSGSDPIMLGVTCTLIFILLVVVIVLTVFLIRMKRNVDGKTPKGGRQHDEFDEYAIPVGVSKSDDLYRSLGKAQRIRAQMNAAFEPEGSNYNDVFGKVGRPAGSDPQGRLEDGYQGDGTTDTPVYQVLDPDAEANEYEEALTANGTGATGEGQPPQRGSNLAGVFAKKRGEGNNDYSHVHAKPPHQKAKGGSEMAAECSPGNADDDYSHISRTPMPDEQDDVYSHVNCPRVTGSSNTEEAAEDHYSQPYGKAKMAAKGWQGNDGDDYNRLELPSLANPSSLAGMQKEGKTAATSGTSRPAPGRVATDDENDYEKACNVVQ